MSRTAEAIDAQIGERIRAARTIKGLTQTAVGVSLGVSFQQVQKYEKGVNRTPIASLMMLATLLDRPLSWFTAQPEQKTREALPRTRNEAEVLTAYRRLSPGAQAAFRDFAIAMADYREAHAPAKASAYAVKHARKTGFAI